MYTLKTHFKRGPSSSKKDLQNKAIDEHREKIPRLPEGPTLGNVKKGTRVTLITVQVNHGHAPSSDKSQE